MSDLRLKLHCHNCGVRSVSRGIDAHAESPSPADLAGEAGALTVGLGILTIQLFPFAMPFTSW